MESRIASEIWSATLSGCPSVTDSELNDIRFCVRGCFLASNWVCVACAVTSTPPRMIRLCLGAGTRRAPPRSPPPPSPPTECPARPHHRLPHLRAGPDRDVRPDHGRADPSGRIHGYRGQYDDPFTGYGARELV